MTTEERPPTPSEPAAPSFEKPKWDLVDAFAIICLDAGALGLGAWIARDLVGVQAHPTAAAFTTALVRPLVVLPALLFITRRWWDVRVAGLGVRRPDAGSWKWFVKFALLVGLGYAVLLGVLALVARGHVDVNWFTRLRASVYLRVQSPVVLPNALNMLVVAPLVEEPVFRGILQPALRERVGRGWSVLACAAVFAGVHILWSWTLFPPWTQFLGGLVFAWSYERTRSLVYPVIFHVIGNAAILSWHLALAYRPGWVEAVLL